MSDVPRERLKEILERYGNSAIEDHDRLEGLLKDYCPGYKKEARVLIDALEAGLPGELIAASDGSNSGLILMRYDRCLIDQYGYKDEVARWAVETWAYALGIYYDPVPATEKNLPPVVVKAESPVQNMQFYAPAPPVNKKSPWIAAVLSFIIPGLGQVYNGQVLKGAICFIAYFILIWFLVGILVWFYTILDAYMVARKINDELIF